MPDRKPGLSTSLRRSFNRARSRGVAEVLSLVSGRARENWNSTEELYLHVRSASPLEKRDEDLTFRRADASDARRYARDIGTDSTATFRSRVADDVMCFIVEDGERILHSSWVTTSAAWTREIRGYLSPPPGDAYVYESFTRADARGRGIYPFALAGMVTRLAEMGIGRVWVGVEASNVASQRAIHKAGFLHSFTLRYRRRIGRFQLDVSAIDGSSAASEFLRVQQGPPGI